MIKVFYKDRAEFRAGFIIPWDTMDDVENADSRLSENVDYSQYRLKWKRNPKPPEYYER